MTQYGYITEDGHLRAFDCEHLTQKELQKLIDQNWKPVDLIDTGKITTHAEDAIVRVSPYDAGDRISFKYEEIYDAQKIRREVESLKDDLASTDYQIIKCYEASLAGEDLPYDVKELHSARQAIRDRINELSNT